VLKWFHIQLASPQLGGLRGLTALYLNDNRLTTVPATLGGLVGLKELHLNGNQLTNVPAALGGLAALEAGAYTRSDSAQLQLLCPPCNPT